MTSEHIDRKQCKWEAAELLRDAQVSPKAMTALYMGLLIVLNLFSALVDTGFFSMAGIPSMAAAPSSKSRSSSLRLSRE